MDRWERWLAARVKGVGSILNLLVAAAAGIVFAFCLSGCIVMHETRIQPDPKVDPRLEGVWKITRKSGNDWAFDYEFNAKGELFLRVFPQDDEVTDLLKMQSIKFEEEEFSFGPSKGKGPIVLKDTEQRILDFYTSPELRALLMSFGKYRQLKAAGE